VDKRAGKVGVYIAFPSPFSQNLSASLLLVDQECLHTETIQLFLKIFFPAVGQGFHRESSPNLPSIFNPIFLRGVQASDLRGRNCVWVEAELGNFVTRIHITLMYYRRILQPICDSESQYMGLQQKRPGFSIRI
jgi:hypothetical protein